MDQPSISIPKTAPNITDTDRMNWLESRPMTASVRGGFDDGAEGKFWGIAAHSGTLREAIDHMLRKEAAARGAAVGGKA